MFSKPDVLNIGSATIVLAIRPNSWMSYMHLECSSRKYYVIHKAHLSLSLPLKKHVFRHCILQKIRPYKWHCKSHMDFGGPVELLISQHLPPQCSPLCVANYSTYFESLARMEGVRSSKMYLSKIFSNRCILWTNYAYARFEGSREWLLSQQGSDNFQLLISF